jgi:hypothetical protein
MACPTSWRVPRPAHGFTGAGPVRKSDTRLGDLDAAWTASTESVAILEQLQKDGDGSEATVVGLARALEVQAGILRNRQEPAALRRRSVPSTCWARVGTADASTAVRETRFGV